jgi:acetolactate synthase I/II/III large subunit
MRPCLQELATVAIDKLPTKMFILNNQHLGMVVQWEDRFYKANRAHTYLGRRVCAQCCPLPAGVLLQL